MPFRPGQFACLAALIVPIITAKDVTARQAHGETSASMERQQTFEPGEPDLKAIIDALAPPALEQVISSLKPIPTVRECLEPTPDDPKALWKQVLASSDRDRIQKLENRIGHLQEQGKYVEAVDHAREILGIHRETQEPSHWEVIDAECKLEYLQFVARLAREDFDRWEELEEKMNRASQLHAQGKYEPAGNLFMEVHCEWCRAFGGENLKAAMVVFQLAATFFYRGDYAIAEPLFTASLVRTRKILGDRHPIFGLILDSLARTLYYQGKYAYARPIACKSLDVRRKALGDGHHHVADSRNILALILQAEDDLESAETLLDQVLECCRRQLGKDHPTVAVYSHNLGRLLLDKGEYGRAEPLLQDALRINREAAGMEPFNVAHCLDALATARQYRGDYENAESLFREALEMRRKIYRINHPDVAKSLNNLGTLLCLKGDYDSAEGLLREALAMHRRLQGDQHPHVVTALYNLAKVLESKGDLAAAEPMFREALTLAETIYPEGHSERARCMTNLAFLLQMKGDYGAAEPLFVRALDIMRKQLGDRHPDVMVATENLGYLHMLKGDFDSSENRYREALAIIRQWSQEGSLKEAEVLQNLAHLLNQRGAIAEAESLQRKAHSILRNRIKEDNIVIAHSLSNLAVMHYDRCEFDESARLTREALTIYRNILGDMHPHVARALCHLAAIHHTRGSFSDAEPLLREALAIVEGQRTRLLGSEKERALYAGELRLHEIASHLAKVLLHLNRADEAFEISERGRGRALLDLLARSDQDLISEARRKGGLQSADALGCLLEEESLARTALTASVNIRETILKRGDISAQEKKKQLRDQDQRILRARLALQGAESAVLAKLRDVWPDAKPLKVEEILAGLNEGEIVLCYNWTDSDLTLMVLSPALEDSIQGFTVVEHKKDIIQLKELIARSRAQISNPIPMRRDLQAAKSHLYELYQQLVGSAPQEIRRCIHEAKRIILLPSGPLNDIPFEALLVSDPSTTEERLKEGFGKEGPYLLDGGPELAYAESATVFINCRYRKTPEGNAAQEGVSALVLGHPAFAPPARERMDSQVKARPIQPLSVGREYDANYHADLFQLNGGTLNPLKGTEREAKSIARLFEDAKGAVSLLLQEEASLDMLEENAAGKRYLHLATHGLSGSRNRPYDACLALAHPKTPDGCGLGFLTLDRIIRNWRGMLSGSACVVLSACDTQKGVRIGDSVMALPWGFMYAGAPTVVASLWQVDDTATVLLMTRFYENLLGRYDDDRGQRHPGTPMTKGTALREAKIWLRNLDRKEAEEKRTALGEDGLRGLSISKVGQEGTTNKPYEHPFFWASFILLGDPK